MVETGAARLDHRSPVFCRCNAANGQHGTAPADSMGQHQRTVGERVGEAGQRGDFSTLYAREAQTEQIMTKPAEKPISAPFGRHRPDSMGQQKRTAWDSTSGQWV